jgi:hypothetical protein
MQLSCRSDRAGFTLFEVSISLALVAFGVVSVLMMLPSGIKSQQMARYRIIAATKAEEMIEVFSSVSLTNSVDTEGLTMWDVPTAHRSQSHDLEARLSSHRYGLMPLPLDIARRIDSDGDELRSILDQGGYVYYSQPGATSQIQEQGQSIAAPNEAQRLVIGIVGAAQQNALSILPVKNWPYHYPMPSPPLHTVHQPDAFLPDRRVSGSNQWNYYAWPEGMRQMWVVDAANPAGAWKTGWQQDWCFPWETAPTYATVPAVATPPEPPAGRRHDPHIQKVFCWNENGEYYGYLPYAGGRRWDSWKKDESTASKAYLRQYPTDFELITSTSGYAIQTGQGRFPSRVSCLRYVQAAAWYFKQHLGPLGIDPPAKGRTPSMDLVYGSTVTPPSDRWKEVQAYRFLAHAATCLTAWYPKVRSGSASADEDDLTDGVKIPQVTLDGQSSPTEFRIDDATIRFLHERALFLVHDFAARYPYDWAVPRPVGRVQMMDYPLLQLDLFSPPYPEPPSSGGVTQVPPDYRHRTGPTSPASDLTRLFGRTAQDFPRQWRPISAQPIRHIGVSQTYPKSHLDPRMGNGNAGPLFGDIRHFNLTQPFSATHRAREIVMWAVDWMSYEDAELVPSAPVDASKYPLAGPRGNWWNGSQIPRATTRDFAGRMWDVFFRDEHLMSYRNPEKVLLFYPQRNKEGTDLIDIAALPTGTDMSTHMIQNNPWGFRADDQDSAQNLGGTYPDRGDKKVFREVFNGRYGADRNYNKRLDRGPVPRSVRMRAIQVARFLFYDPRVPLVLR